MKYSRTFMRRFHKKLDKSTGCWIWTRGTNGKGYGQTRTPDGRCLQTHRLAWEHYKGDIPPGLRVCHDCPGGDNPLCCNPKHLFLGTDKDNAQDARKKRIAAGWVSKVNTPESRQPRMTEADVLAIADMLDSGMTLAAIASRQNVSVWSVFGIKAGKQWQWLTGDRPIKWMRKPKNVARVTMVMTQEERDIITDAANVAGRTLSDYCKAAVLSQLEADNA